MVHRELDHHGFTHALIGFARENGVAAYTGDGSNRWPAANTYDIGVLYRLALEKAPAGSTFHGVGDTGISRKVIAETIAGKLGVETKSITDEEAPQYLGFLAAFAGFDNPTSNDKTRRGAGLGADPSRLGRGRGDGPLLRLRQACGSRHAVCPRGAQLSAGITSAASRSSCSASSISGLSRISSAPASATAGCRRRTPRAGRRGCAPTSRPGRSGG